MSDWSEGYLTEIDYSHGYFPVLSPGWLRFMLLLAGYVPPPEDGAYLELGYGQGLSAVIHGAGTPCSIWGTDYNARQAANARTLADAAGIDARLVDQSFAELAVRTDLPKFAYICLHGIWSWVSPENRDYIVQILDRCLVPGGVAFVSYNCLPGWGAALPLWKLLMLHADSLGAEIDDPRARIDAGLGFARTLADAGAGYFKANPAVAAVLDEIAGKDRTYLAHELLNEHWHPMGFSEVAGRFAEARFSYACSAHPLEDLARFSLAPAASALVDSVSLPLLRETMLDFLFNRRFRQDLYLRGGASLTRLERDEALGALLFTLVREPKSIGFRLKMGVGEILLDQSIYRPVIEALSRDDYAPCSLAELAARMPSLSFAQLIEIMRVLVGAGHAHPAQTEAAAARSRRTSTALNVEFLRRAREGYEGAWMVSPVTGCGIAVSPLEHLFAAAVTDGEATPEGCTDRVLDSVSAQQRSFRIRGSGAATRETVRADLLPTAEAFIAERLPLLRALRIL